MGFDIGYRIKRYMRVQNISAIHESALISGKISDYVVHDHGHIVSTKF